MEFLGKVLIKTTFALPYQCFALVFQTGWATTTTLLGRRLVILAAGMASHTSEGETIKVFLIKQLHSYQVVCPVPLQL